MNHQKTLIQVFMFSRRLGSFVFLQNCYPGLSLEALGMRALERIPRDRAIDGIHAFNKMKWVSL